MKLTILEEVVNVPHLYLCRDENGNERCIDFGDYENLSLTKGMQINVFHFEATREKAIGTLSIVNSIERICSCCLYWKRNKDNNWGRCDYHPVPQWMVRTFPTMIPPDWNVENCECFAQWQGGCIIK